MSAMQTLAWPMCEQEPLPAFMHQPDRTIFDSNMAPSVDREHNAAEAIDRWVNEGGALPLTSDFLPTDSQQSTVF